LIAKEKYDKKISTDNTNKVAESMYNVTTGKTTETIDKIQEISDQKTNILR
jgi:hypothetical protein